MELFFGSSNRKTHCNSLLNVINYIDRYSLQDSFNVHRSAQFNVAENIATTSDMPYNAEKLLHRMKLDRR